MLWKQRIGAIAATVEKGGKNWGETYKEHWKVLDTKVQQTLGQVFLLGARLADGQLGANQGMVMRNQCETYEKAL